MGTNPFTTINEQRLKNTNLTSKENISIYTDGSYSKEKKLGAYAFVATKNNQVIHSENGILINPESWNINGELKAVTEGITWAIKNNYKEIVIFTDLQMAATIFYRNNPKADMKAKQVSKDYKNKIEIFKTLANITVIWIKGHNNNYFNDIADNLANELVTN